MSGQAWPISPDMSRLRDEVGLGELRRDALGLVQGIVLALAVLVLVGTGATIMRYGEAPAYVAIVLALGVGASHRLKGRDAPLATTALVTGCIAAVALALWLFPSAALASFLVVPVLAAAVLIGPEGGAATLAAGGAAAGAALTAAGGDPYTMLLPALGLCCVVLALAIVLWRPLYTVLDWSWASYAEAQRRTEELRARQGELAQLNRGLNQAYERLEHVTAQLERARQAAEEARRLKTEFAASVSHELRTPVNLIIGLSELMVVEPHGGAPALPDVYRADAEAIYRNACHVSNLIDDVLDLSQVEAHRMGIVREWVSLSDVVAQASATVRTLFDNTGLRLDVRIPADLPPVFADPVRVRQILINLLNNAVRFTEEGGVTIEARVEGDQVVVDTTDTGVGIAPEDLPGVFHEFWRSGEPVRGRKGSGLGLAVSKRFAELHGGNLWVASTLGQGSTFSLSLPLGEKAVVQETELGVPLWQRIEQRAPESPRVLLVDPEPEALRVFSRYLDGYQVVVAPDAAAAAALTAADPPRAAIVGTPTRRDALRRAIEEAGAPTLPIVTCRLRTARTIARELGVVEYLVKPVAQHDLRRVLRRFPRAPRDLLIVDDDPEMRHVLGRMVGALLPRCRVRTAGDGQEALALAAEHAPDGVLLDLLMPRLDGYGVIELLRAEPGLEAVPVVVITARGAEDDGLVADGLEISRPGGLRVGELTRWIRGGLDLQRPGSADRRAAPATPRASPASAGAP